MQIIGKEVVRADAYAELLAKAQPALYAFTSMLLGSREEARDVLQETNLMLMCNAANYDGSRPFLPWAKAFAYNQVRRHVKSRVRGKLVFSSELVDLIAQNEQEHEEETDAERLGILSWCLGKLAEGQRRLIQSRYFEGRTIKSLALEQKKSANSVYVQLHRVRTALGRCIETALKRRSDNQSVGGTV